MTTRRVRSTAATAALASARAGAEAAVGDAEPSA
jgi:hypothetical protein